MTRLLLVLLFATISAEAVSFEDRLRDGDIIFHEVFDSPKLVEVARR